MNKNQNIQRKYTNIIKLYHFPSKYEKILNCTSLSVNELFNEYRTFSKYRICKY